LRTPRATLLGSYQTYLRERVLAVAELIGVRLLREVRERGYAGGVTQLNDFLRTVRPAVPRPSRSASRRPLADRRRSTSRTSWSSSRSSPVQHRVWCRHRARPQPLPVGQYVLHQDLGTVLRCHMLAFEHFGGTPHEILYDRMKTGRVGRRTTTRALSTTPSSSAWARTTASSPGLAGRNRAKTKARSSERRHTDRIRVTWWG